MAALILRNKSLSRYANGDGLIWFPAGRNASDNRPSLDAADISPLRSGQRASEGGYFECAASIRSLLLGSSPLAILWRIGAVIVNAINGMKRGWTRPHVGYKRVKIRSPLIAHFDATLPVSRVLRRGYGIASLKHAAPNFVKRMICLTRGLWFPRANAAARSGVAASQIAESHNPFSATLANAINESDPTILLSEGQNAQFSEPFADERSFGCREWHPHMVSQSRYLQGHLKCLP